MLHFLGEVEAVFGVWVLPLLAVLAATRGPRAPERFLGGLSFTEPLFVFAVMAIASTRPVLRFTERALGLGAGLLGGTPFAWWLVTLTIGPLLGSLVTEPAAMVICALLLSRRVLALGPSPRLAYATAFNDNAAITYLASLVPDLSAEARVAVVAGAVAGGGLTVIANAPNPAGQALLARHFPGGVSPGGLFLGALLPTAVAAAAYLILP